MGDETKKPSSNELLICFCHGIPESEIRQAIKAGSRTLKDIKERTKASTGCGGCTDECVRILAEMLGKIVV